MSVYYILVLPLSLLKPSQAVSAIYNEQSLLSPFPFIFPLWRDYENFHIVCWLGKDLALYLYLVYFMDVYLLWTLCVIPTAIIGIHFVILTFFVKSAFIDHIHYYSQFMWLSANFVWAFGEIFKPFGGDHDDAVSFMIFGVKSFITFRWWCSWLLVSAIFPIFILYMYWIPAAYLYREIDSTAVDSSSDVMSYQNSEYCSLLNVVKIRNPNEMNCNNNDNNNDNRRYGLFEEGSSSYLLI